MGLGKGKTLQGYRELDPLRQGGLDRLCGLYAIINATRLAAHPQQPITRRQQNLLFDAGIEFFRERSRLLGVHLFGMNERPWIRLREHLLIELGAMRGPRLRAERLILDPAATIDGALEAIFASIDAGAPVLIELRGAYDHFTVVAGYSRSSLLLFDSSGLRWIGLRTVGSRRPRATSRHKISIRSLCRLATIAD